MRLTVVGCSGSFPGPDSAASCYLVEAADAAGRTWRVLLDLGNGAIGPLHRHIDPLSVDAVFLSHLHADHCMDLCGLYVMRKYHPDGVESRIPVYGPHDVALRMCRAYDLPPTQGMSREFEFYEYDAQAAPIQVGPMQVEVARVAHPVPAYALRVSHEGRTLVYSGDTGPCDALVDLAQGAGLLLCEASFLEDDDNPADLHMTGREAAEHAAKAGAERLVLTHIPPWYDAERVLAEAAPYFSGDLSLAAPGRTIAL
ncbi:MAG: MBL fold metallo-hydrolase [Nocardioidaceae bacterium]